jgi:hypothetical protein
MMMAGTTNSMNPRKSAIPSKRASAMIGKARDSARRIMSRRAISPPTHHLERPIEDDREANELQGEYGNDGEREQFDAGRRLRIGFDQVGQTDDDRHACEGEKVGGVDRPGVAEDRTETEAG